MKKWMSLLLAGVLASVFMIGCNKEPEGDTNNAAPPTKESTMDTKGPTTPGTDSGKMGEGATAGGAGETKTDGAAGGDKMGAGDAKAGEGK